MRGLRNRVAALRAMFGTAGAAPKRTMLDTHLLRRLVMVYLLLLTPASRAAPQSATVKSLRTCSVVSTSGALAAHEDGARIDAADAVVRLGWGPTTPAMAPYIGNRTDLRLATPIAFWEAHKVTRASVHAALRPMSNGSRVLFLTLGGWCLPAMSAIASCYPALDVAYMDDGGVLTRVAKRSLGSNASLPTSGLISMFYLLLSGMCDTLQLWGFYEDHTSLSKPYHYFTSGDGGFADGDNISLAAKYGRRGPGHKFMDEHAMLLKRSIGDNGTGTAGRPFVLTRASLLAGETAPTKIGSVNRLSRGRLAEGARPRSCNYPKCGGPAAPAATKRRSLPHAKSNLTKAVPSFLRMQRPTLLG